jgi:hypothetical protein
MESEVALKSPFDQRNNLKIPLIEDLYTSSGVPGEPWSLVDVHANNTI